MDIIHLVISDDIFGGFEHFYKIPDTPVTMDDIIKSIINKLYNLLRSNSLDVAVCILQTKKFHIHDFTVEELKNVNEIIYVCCH